MCGFMLDTGSSISEEIFETELEKFHYRGPDNTKVEVFGNIKIGFHRLSIMDTSFHGHQPFIIGDWHLVCNGEVYNYHELKTEAEKTGYKFHSGSDCEVLLPLLLEWGIEKLSKRLDAEYALAAINIKTGEFVLSRDPIGIRPLFWGKEKKSGKLIIASEAKGLVENCQGITPFLPGHFFDSKTNRYLQYEDPTVVTKYESNLDKILKDIRESLTEGVRKRLASDVPIGFLLSGGLDSSLVCAIANDLMKKPITTFAVGLNQNPIDIGYAKIVADHIKSNHHEVYFTMDDVFKTLEDLIFRLETWDITTIRASLGMTLVCKYVREKTAVRVLMTGEVSDELLGYKYTDFAPSAAEFQKEAGKRIRELYMYDVLRADRCISSNSLEARVPFADRDFVKVVMSIDPELKLNKYGMGKYLLRKAFDGTGLLPDSILWREKAAFSDAVGHSMVDELKAYAERTISSEDLEKRSQKFTHGKPISKESLWYREIFEKNFSHNEKLIADFWLPNRDWQNCNVQDPSARVLPNYGKSGV